MAVEARYFLDGQGFSARFADFVPQEMKYVALIEMCIRDSCRSHEGFGGISVIQIKNAKELDGMRKANALSCLLYTSRCV